MKKRSGFIYEVAIIAVVVVILAILLFPFCWIFITSLRDENHIFSETLSFGKITFENYRGLLKEGFGRFFVNSTYLSLITVVFTVLIASLAAYAFSRMKFFGRKELLLTVIGSQMFPWVVLLTPIYMMFWRFRLVNTHSGLFLLYIGVNLPYAIYLLVGYFSSIPKELDEAAIIDGCSVIGTIFRVVLPVALPGLVATATYCFVQVWNEYLFALTLITRTELKTLPLGLGMFFGEYTAEWGKVMAASALTSIPTVLFFLILNRYLIAGLTAGAVKE